MSLDDSFFNTPSASGPVGNTTPISPAPVPTPGPSSSLDSQFFGSNAPKSVQYDPSELKSVSLDHPWETFKSVLNGASRDTGALVSGLGNIAATPFKIVNNLVKGRDSLDDTVLAHTGMLAYGLINQLAGGDGTAESQGMTSYYSQYMTHPLDMVVNHPVNTLLDLASLLDLGATSAGAISKTGKVGTILKAGREAQVAGDAEKAAELFDQAKTLQSSSTSGKVSSALSKAQSAINPVTLVSKGVGAVLSKTAPTIKSQLLQTFNRGAALGLDNSRQADFLRTANQFESMTEQSKAAFLQDLEPKVAPLVNNPELTKIVTDALDRPSLVKDMPAVKTIVDGIQDVFNKHITEPELSSKLLNYLSQDGYMEHIYEAPADTLGTQRYRSYLVNGKNDQAAQILRFDPVNAGDKYFIGTQDFHNLTETEQGSSPYRMFQDDKGAQYTAKRPTYSELADAGLQPKGLADSLEHRANTSFSNQAKVKVLDNLGSEFGQLDKPTEMTDSLGHKWVKSTTIRTPDGQFYYVPEDVENAAKNYFSYLPHNNLVQALMSGGQMFKTLLYAFPGSSLVHSFHIAFNSVLGGLTIPDIIRAVRGIKNEDPIFAKYKAMGGGTQLNESYFTHTPKTVSDLVKPDTLLSKIKDSALNPFGENYVQNKLLSKEGDFLHHTLYRKGLLQGMSEGEALDFANKFAGHYSNLTDEERMLQAIFPFYSWMKQSVPLNANALTEQAGKLNLGRWLSSGFQLQENDNVAKGQIPIGKDAQGKEHYLTAPIPLNDIRSLLEDLPSFAYTRLNPVLSVPWSIGTNKKNPFSTDPNLQSFNRITSDVAPNQLDELKYASGKFFNPLSLLFQHKSLHDFLLNSGGLYESIVDASKQQFYDKRNLINDYRSVQKDYRKAIKAGDVYHATFFNRASQLFEQELQNAPSTPPSPTSLAPSSNSVVVQSATQASTYNRADFTKGFSHDNAAGVIRTQNQQRASFGSKFSARATNKDSVRSESNLPTLQKPPTVQFDDLPQYQSQQS